MIYTGLQISVDTLFLSLRATEYRDGKPHYSGRVRFVNSARLILYHNIRSGKPGTIW